jgi:glycosyltransferase involved in cell wall biosynthesis
VLLFVGQITHAKGVLDVVDALGQLPASSKPPPLLLLIGTPHPASIVGEIEAHARAGDVREDVRLLGQREDVYRWMQAADILVSGSHQDTEGMSRVLYEAMACGAVPVGTDIRGTREVVTPDVGVLVPERSPADLAGGLGLLLREPERRAALAAESVRRAHESFDITSHARGVEAFLLELCRSR